MGEISIHKIFQSSNTYFSKISKNFSQTVIFPALGTFKSRVFG